MGPSPPNRGKKIKDNELEDYLLAETIQQNSELLKKKKHHKKSIASFFGAQEKSNKKDEANTDDPVPETPQDAHKKDTMNMETTTDSPATCHKDYSQATATIQDATSEQSQSDSENGRENWEDSQDEDDN